MSNYILKDKYIHKVLRNDNVRENVGYSYNNANPKSSAVISIKVSQYSICKYDDLYWIGITSEIDSSPSDINVTFMHPHYPIRSYRWPASEDVCWEPSTHIITTTKTPSMSSVSGRRYHISSYYTLAIQYLIWLLSNPKLQLVIYWLLLVKCNTQSNSFQRLEHIRFSR